MVMGTKHELTSQPANRKRSELDLMGDLCNVNALPQ